MISDILSYLKTQLEAQYPEMEVKGLCERIEKEDNTYEIGEYSGRGEYSPVNPDAYKALLYYRQDGEITSKEVDEEETVSCEVVESVTYPLRVVFFATKDFRDTCGSSDTAYASRDIAESLKKTLTIRNDSSLRSVLKAYSVYARVTAIDTDMKAVADAEGMGYDFSHTLLALKLEIEVQASQSCFSDCDNDPYLTRFFRALKISEGIEGITDAGKKEDYLSALGCNDSPVTVRNSDNSYSVSETPGADLLLPDEVITINGTPHTKPSVKDASYTVPVPPATVHNSDNSYSVSVASGGDLLLPDSSIKNSAGVEIHSLPATRPQTISDSHIRKSDGTTNLLDIKAENYKTTLDVYNAATEAEIAADVKTVGKDIVVYRDIWGALSKYDKILQRAYELGATLPGATLQTKQLQLISDLGSNWDSMDYLFIFANNQLDDFGRINWINPQLSRAVKWGFPTLVNTGFQGNGSSGGSTGWLITEYYPNASKGSLNDYYLGGVFSNANTEMKCYMGAANLSDVGACVLYSNGLYGVNSRAILNHGLGAVSGTMFASRSDANNSTFTLNGTAYSFADASPLGVTCNYHIMNEGRIGLSAANNVCTFNQTVKIVVAGKASTANLATLRTAFNTYLNSI